jgi:hypothetical protein
MRSTVRIADIEKGNEDADQYVTADRNRSDPRMGAMIKACTSTHSTAMQAMVMAQASGSGQPNSA